MPQDKAISRFREGLSLTDKAGTLTREGALLLEEFWRQIVPGFIIVPCIVTNAGNVYTLTARLHAEGARSYADGLIFWGVASAGSTGAVTARVANAQGTALPTVKVYINGGSTQAGNTDIVSGRLYLWCFVQALDAGAGGLVLK